MHSSLKKQIVQSNDHSATIAKMTLSRSRNFSSNSIVLESMFHFMWILSIFCRKPVGNFISHLGSQQLWYPLVI